jgi:hypothetical protein
MKAVNLVEKALALTGEPDVKTLLSDFLRANTIAKNEQFDLSKYVSNNEMRESITGIYHENGFRIATNGYILCAVDDDYPEELEGKTVSPKGHIIEGKYPAWQSVLPNVDELTGMIFTKTVVNILQKIREEQKVAKINGENVFVKIAREEETVYFNANMFVLFLNFIKTFRKTRIGVKYCDSNSNIFAKDDSGNRCLLMCQNVNDCENIVELSYLKINIK